VNQVKGKGKCKTVVICNSTKVH